MLKQESNAIVELAEHFKQKSISTDEALAAIAKRVRELSESHASPGASLRTPGQSAPTAQITAALQNALRLTNAQVSNAACELGEVRQTLEELKKSQNAVELAVQNNHIVWRSGGQWKKLISIDLLRGARGVNGTPGLSSVTDGTGTAISGLLKGNGSKVSAAEPGVDYAAPVHTHDYSSLTGKPPSVPTGTILEYGGSAAPAGYLLCNGLYYSIAAYSALFGVIGVQYGGDGRSTFGVPNRSSPNCIIKT